jgi:hypothetical protein
MVEMALVFPLFLMVLMGIIVLGTGVFYHQQMTNAAREGSRFAALHSATAQCPTVSNLDPDTALLPLPNSYYRCDTPETRWPEMVGHARDHVFAMPRGDVRVTACWSGYWTKDSLGNWAAHDQVARDPSTGMPNDFRQCTVEVFGWCPGQSGPSTQHTINPRTGLDPTCPPTDPQKPPLVKLDCTKEFPTTSVANDMASNYAASNADNANQVTVVACYAWRPPLAGFLLIPETVTLRATVTEAMEYQQ